MKKSVVFLILICVFACTEETEFEDSKVDFSNLHVQTPVVLSHFSSDSLLFVTVGSTQQAFDDGDEPDFPIIENATIKNLKTGIVKGLDPDLYRKNQYFSDISLTEGVAYRINLEFPEIIEKQVWATDTIPFSSEIKSISVTPKAKKADNDLLTLVQLEILPSPCQQESNYEISVVIKITDTLDTWGFPLDSIMLAPSSPYLYSDDPLITREEFYPSLLQFDASPPKKLYCKKQHYIETFQMEFYYSPPSETRTTLSNGETTYHIYSHTSTIYFKTISENYYKYHVSRLSQFYSRKGDPLYGVGESVNVHSNIENGIGIFAAYTTDSIKINYKSE